MSFGLALLVAFVLGFVCATAIASYVVRDYAEQLAQLDSEMQWRRVTGTIRRAD